MTVHVGTTTRLHPERRHETADVGAHAPALAALAMSFDEDDDATPTSALDRTFAVILAEIEDAATELTNRHAQLARELADVEEQLQRIEGVRAAMAGKPKAKRVKQSSKQERDVAYHRERVSEHAKPILDWARQQGDGFEFIGGDVADALDLPWQGMGPRLAGMARRGELVMRQDARQRFYRLPDDT